MQQHCLSLGILSTRIPQLWEERDFQQIRSNGNKRTNNVLLAKSPVWQYKPSGNDGIKLKVNKSILILTPISFKETLRYVLPFLVHGDSSFAGWLVD